MFLQFGQAWVRLRATEQASAYSNKPTLSWTHPDELGIYPCTVGTGSSTETLATDIAALSSVRTWYGPAGADVKAGDRLRDPQGIVWTVEGEPFDHGQNPHPLTGWAPGCFATIRRYAP